MGTFPGSAAGAGGRSADEASHVPSRPFHPVGAAKLRAARNSLSKNILQNKTRQGNKRLTRLLQAIPRVPRRVGGFSMVEGGNVSLLLRMDHGPDRRFGSVLAA